MLKGIYYVLNSGSHANFGKVQATLKGAVRSSNFASISELNMKAMQNILGKFIMLENVLVYLSISDFQSRQQNRTILSAPTSSGRHQLLFPVPIAPCIPIVPSTTARVCNKPISDASARHPKCTSCRRAGAGMQ